MPGSRHWLTGSSNSPLSASLLGFLDISRGRRTLADPPEMPPGRHFGADASRRGRQGTNRSVRKSGNLSRRLHCRNS
jgi:hypothetical protein